MPMAYCKLPNSLLDRLVYRSLCRRQPSEQLHIAVRLSGMSVEYGETFVIQARLFYPSFQRSTGWIASILDLAMSRHKIYPARKRGMADVINCPWQMAFPRLFWLSPWCDHKGPQIKNNFEWRHLRGVNDVRKVQFSRVTFRPTMLYFVVAE